MLSKQGLETQENKSGWPQFGHNLAGLKSGILYDLKPISKQALNKKKKQNPGFKSEMLKRSGFKVWSSLNKKYCRHPWFFLFISGTICHQQDLSVHESAQGAEWEKKSSEF